MEVPRRLLLGFIFVFLTNAFAVFAPVVIGEGVNALQDAYTRFLLPLSEGTPAAEVFRDAASPCPSRCRSSRNGSRSTSRASACQPTERRSSGQWA